MKLQPDFNTHRLSSRQICKENRRTHHRLKLYKKYTAIRKWNASSAAPATQNEPEVVQVLHLPHKTNMRCSRRCACHTKPAGGAPGAAPATQNDAAPKVITRRRTSADLYEGGPSAAPATQKRTWGAPSSAPATQNDAVPKVITRRRTSAVLYEFKVLQVLHLPRKNEHEVLQVLRLPRKTTRRPKSSLGAWLPLTSMKVLQRKTNLRCCACQAKQAGGAPSAAPAHTKQRGAQSHHSSPDFRWPLWRCSKCCTCHAKWTWGAPSAAPATQKRTWGAPSAAPARKRSRNAPSTAPAPQNDTFSRVITRRRASADLYEGAPIAAPATQKEFEVLQALRLPRKTSRRCSKCCACHAKRRGAQSHHLAPDFRWPLWRCSNAKRT